jgi:hypothetical protein
MIVKGSFAQNRLPNKEQDQTPVGSGVYMAEAVMVRP